MTAHWTSLPLLSVDTETSGVDPATDRIVEAAAVTVAADGTVTDTWCRIIDPGIDIPEDAANIHGITTDRARAEGTRPVIALRELASRLKSHPGAVVLYNALFDWPLLRAEAARHGIHDFPGALILDPLVLDRHLDKYRKGQGMRRLTAVCELYGVQLSSDDAHGAVADATAAGQLMWAMVAREPRIASIGLPDLQAWQARWSDEQRLDFAAWKRRSEPDFDEPLGWPLPEASAA